MTRYSFRDHLPNSESLITPHSETRAGFIAIALEKNNKASPFVEEAKALRVLASKARVPNDLLSLTQISSSLLTASGISDKATSHLNDEDKNKAIIGLIENFLEPAGADFVDELVYRFLLTRGDSLGGKMRNIAGALGEKKFIKTLLSTGGVQGIKIYYKSKVNEWATYSVNEFDFEQKIKGLSWNNKGGRTMLFNVTIPLIRKNVDICLFNTGHDSNDIQDDDSYIALGELKGGIDPAGADEHWKTANSALNRIREAYHKNDLKPFTFFIGAAIETSMASEIYAQLENGTLSNAANLTNEHQTISLCNWILDI